MNDQNVLKFFTFIAKRQQIWHNRFIEEQPAPWTDDIVLQRFLFCNCYRELDAGTKVMIHALAPYAFDRKRTLLNVLAYRLFNIRNWYTDVMPEPIPEDFNRLGLEKVLDNALSRGVQLFRPAYTLCQVPVNKEYRKSEKHIQQTFILEWLSKNLNSIVGAIDLAETVERVLFNICRIPNVGHFLGFQVLQDLTYFNFYNQGWTENDFCFVGPGAETGIDLIEGVGVIKPKNMPGYLKELRDSQPQIFADVWRATGIDWRDIYYRDAYHEDIWLSWQALEHCMCEYRKYVNVTKDITDGTNTCRKRYYYKEN